MARSFDQILAEVNKQSDPARQTVLRQIADLPSQQKAEESGLRAQLSDANDEILGDARRRGLGFAGIPVGEQAKFAATEFAPAAARLSTSFNDRRDTLESALAGIGSQNFATAQDIFNSDRTFAESQRQFNEQLRQQQQAARSAGAGGFSLSAGGGAPGQGQPQTLGGSTGAVDPELQTLFNQVFVRPDGNAWSDQDLVNDYNATAASARFGNSRDKQKLELYHGARPDLFGSSLPSIAFGNGATF